MVVGGQPGRGHPPLAGSHRGEAGAGRAAGPEPPDGNTSLLTRCGFRVIRSQGFLVLLGAGTGARCAPSPWPLRGSGRARCHRGPISSGELFPTCSDGFQAGAARSRAGLQRCYKHPFIQAQNRFVLVGPPRHKEGDDSQQDLPPLPTLPSTASAPAAAGKQGHPHGVAGVSLCLSPSPLCLALGTSCPSSGGHKSLCEVGQSRPCTMEMLTAFCPGVRWTRAGWWRLGVRNKHSATCSPSICCLKPSWGRCKSPRTSNSVSGLLGLSRRAFPSPLPRAHCGAGLGLCVLPAHGISHRPVMPELPQSPC